MPSRKYFVSYKNYFIVSLLHYTIKPFYYILNAFSFKKQKAKKILFIELGHLGDMLTSTRAIELVKLNFKEYEIDCICSKSGANGLINNHIVNNIIVIEPPCWYEDDKRGNFFKVLGSFLNLVSSIKNSNAEIVVNFRSTSYHLDHLAIAFSGVKRKVGFGHKGLDFLMSDAYIPHPNSEIIPLLKIELIYNWLKIPLSNGLENRPLFFPNTSFGDNIKNLFLENNISTQKKIIAINVGAQHNFWWPINRVQDLCELIHDKLIGFQIVFVGLKEHEFFVEEIRNKLNFSTTSLLGKTDLSLLYEFMHQIEVLFTIDTGIRHIANAAGANVIVLRSGAENYNAFGKYISTEWVLINKVSCSPCGKKNCPLNTNECINGITALSVFQQLETLIGLKKISLNEA